MLLAERLRNPEEKAVVLEVVQRHCNKAQINLQKLYVHDGAHYILQMLAEREANVAAAGIVVSAALAASKQKMSLVSAVESKPEGVGAKNEKPSKKSKKRRRKEVKEAEQPSRKRPAPAASVSSSPLPLPGSSTGASGALDAVAVGGNPREQLDAIIAKRMKEQQEKQQQEAAASMDETASLSGAKGRSSGGGLGRIAWTKAVRRLITLVGRCLQHKVMPVDSE
jgi:hypothetical protein